MIDRPFWKERIEKAWGEAPIVWLAGVRRSGKTTLAHSLGDDRIYFVNCDLPIVEDMVADPELFYRNCTRSIIVFDEIHQLRDPSRVLKIGADVFPDLKILATGSSTLAASKKFKDTLTGRKRLVHLMPVPWDELNIFSNSAILKRLYHGGLPPALLSEDKQSSFYREWIDSFFARDIQRLFGFRNIDKFNALFEYIMKQSGGLLDSTRIAGALGVSRATVVNHVQALEETHAITLVRPFYGGGRKELIKMPKVYGFDTGFVSFCRGWDPLRTDDYGILWEHLVLEYLQAHEHDKKIHFWRDSAGHEIDFIIPKNRDEIDVIECKWDPTHFESASLKLFRSYYPKGNNFIVSPLSIEGYSKKFGGLPVFICNPDGYLNKRKESTTKNRP